MCAHPLTATVAPLVYNSAVSVSHVQSQLPDALLYPLKLTLPSLHTLIEKSPWWLASGQRASANVRAESADGLTQSEIVHGPGLPPLLVNRVACVTSMTFVALNDAA